MYDNKIKLENGYIDIYMNFHISQIRDQHECIRNAWLIGQELYSTKIRKVEYDNRSILK